MYSFLDTVQSICINDHVSLCKSDESYGDSWKKRGGVGAFMMLARKWDRIANLSKQHSYDIFQAFQEFPDLTGVIDDIRDLRRYLLQVEAEMVQMGHILPEPFIKEESDADTAVST